ncbi:hypothetical protein [Psychrobacter pygoscelis]|uniref:hypothetical protein n=1 Tax=Psychrobacter pygoscelis TaxID=2488563 RepID=UPI00103A34F5|nr:hypothetical protein [Psychrobacter pygoscelis]
MNIESLADLEQLKKDVAVMIKAVKDLDKKSTRYQSLDFNSSTAQRSRALEALNLAASERNRAKDNLHATLVDLGLTPLLGAEHYEPREIQQAKGVSGFSSNLKYQPKRPKRLGAE